MILLKGKIKQESTRDKVYSAIREAILSGQLRTGQRLPEVALAHDLRVSRAVVREALQQLAHEGLVEQRPYKGTRVVELSARKFNEIISLRLLLETEALKQARRHLTEEDRSSFRDLLQNLRQAAVNDPKKHAELDLALHRRIWELSGNELLVNILSQITAPLLAVGVIVRFSPALNLPQERQRQLPADHGELVDRLCDGTEEQAVEALQAHLRRMHWVTHEDVRELQAAKGFGDNDQDPQINGRPDRSDDGGC